MYCSECGCLIDDPTIRFCPECGTRTDQDAGDKSVAKDGDGIVGGIIFTNVRLLARKFSVTEDLVLDILNQFVQKKSSYGVSYRIVDVGNYTYRKKGIFSTGKTVHLKADSRIEDFMAILLDVHEREEKASEYLFIIGGEDIIPMPRIANWLAESTGDEDVDTDLLYAYPYGEDVVRLTENMEIFKYDCLFHVGRLPLSTDSTLKTLADWLSRDLEVSSGIKVRSAYGQCDPNWMNVTARVAAELAQSHLFPDISGRLPAKYSYRNILLSPMVIAEDGTADKLVSPEASLYYFNMHGSNALSERGYSGQALPEDGKTWCHGIMPEHLGACRKANIVVTEACYGARFEGLDSRHSMLLSALDASTMVFAGSSRVAWGAVDSSGVTPETASMSSADVLANVFISSILAGYTAGQAFFHARSFLLQNTEYGNPYTALTITEFNLYGDPTLFAVPENGCKGKSSDQTPTSMLPKGAEKAIVRIAPADARAAGGSPLELVRSAVDAGILEIHESIARYLYDEYGVEARRPESVLRLDYRDGSKGYCYTYRAGSHEDGRPCLYSVSASSDGKVKNVIATK